jgi:hypothetical protein
MWADVAGWLGTAVLLVSYALVSAGKADASRRRHHAVNAVGALALAAASLRGHAYSAATANLSWALIAVVSIARVQVARRAARAGTGERLVLVAASD